MDQESFCDENWDRSSGNEAEGHRARTEVGLWEWGEEGEYGSLPDSSSGIGGIMRHLVWAGGTG